MNTRDIEIAVARHFGWRQNIIIPNVHWGWGLRYEADMVIVRPSGYAIEIEIKLTASDIKADQKKRHQHNDNKFRQLLFAVPEKLATDENIPAKAGIMAIRVDVNGTPMFFVKTIRAAKLNKSACQLDDKEIRKLLELGCMRVWNLKERMMTS